MTPLGRPSWYLILVLLLSVVACDSAEEEDNAPASLTGQWAGSVTFQEEAATLVLDLTQEQTAVTGTGQIVAPSETVAFQVQGSYVAPSISVELQFGDRRPGNVNGLVGEDLQEVVVSVTGPSLSGVDVEMTRQ